VHIRIRTHVTAAASTHVAVLCWRPALARFDHRCLLISSERIPAVSDRNGDFWQIEFRPEPPAGLPSLPAAVRDVL
jgi:hypothetical protein